MGQQQLLLVILVTIIVGIATVVAINVFGTAADNANIDAVRQDMLAAATAAQGWYLKPAMLGGGGNSYDNLTLQNLNIPGTYDGEDATLIVTNANGVYRLVSTNNTVGEGAQFQIAALPNSQPDEEITLEVTMITNQGRIVPDFAWGDLEVPTTP